MRARPGFRRSSEVAGSSLPASSTAPSAVSAPWQSERSSRPALIRLLLAIDDAEMTVGVIWDEATAWPPGLAARGALRIAEDRPRAVPGERGANGIPPSMASTMPWSGRRERGAP